MKRLLVLGFLLCLSASACAAAEKHILLIAGKPSHGTGAHEFQAGCHLLKKCLDKIPGIHSEVHLNGWPADSNAFDRVDAVFLYMDGGSGHPAIKPERLKILGDLMKKGVGLGCAHYAVEVPKGEAGQAWLDWTGGYFEAFWSVNPHWDADFKDFPKHPITRGVRPFKINDEWYYHMRFPEDMKGVTPILTAVPPDRTRGQPGASSSHGGNSHVQARLGMPEHVLWAIERADGGRGFGFTGGHFHRNWTNDDFRKIVLNAIVWTAKADVPADGVASVLTQSDLEAHLDLKPK